MQKFSVVSLGGSLIVPNGGPATTFLNNFRETILRFVGDTHRFFIVTGGGMTTRAYQKAARKIVDLPDEDIDWLGIHVTHLNGHLLRTIFRNQAHVKVLTHYSEKEDISEPITIAAGWKPGHSTDYDAVMFAQLYGSDTVVNLSNIPFVYDKDPNKFNDAIPLKEVSWRDFRKIVGDTWTPGDNLPFDPIASKEAEKSNLKVVVMDGQNLQNFENFLENKEFEGTIIS